MMTRTLRSLRWQAALFGGVATLGMVLVPPAAAEVGSSGGSRADTAVVCDGDGHSGKRVQLIYVRGESDEDRYGEWAPKFQEFAATIDDYVARAATATGGERHIRYVHDSACQPIVDNVVVPDGEMSTVDSIANALRASGYDSTDRNYLFWYERDGCGLAFGGGGDDRPGADNPYNQGRHFAALGTGCWTWQASGHELLHSLGAVQASAPHATTFGHCWDDEDIMCYDDGGIPEPPGSLQKVCGGDENQIDCNKDDYFNVNPPAGSYLATHWNVARNKFLIGA